MAICCRVLLSGVLKYQWQLLVCVLVQRCWPTAHLVIPIHTVNKQCFPRLDGSRGKHPRQGLSSQTGLALTSRLRAGIGQLLPGRRPTHNWQSSQGLLHNVTSHMRNNSISCVAEHETTVQRLRVFLHFQLSTTWLNRTVARSAPLYRGCVYLCSFSFLPHGSGKP